jgi:hypothetical protein
MPRTDARDNEQTNCFRAKIVESFKPEMKPRDLPAVELVPVASLDFQSGMANLGMKSILTFILTSKIRMSLKRAVPVGPLVAHPPLNAVVEVNSLFCDWAETPLPDATRFNVFRSG